MGVIGSFLEGSSLECSCLGGRITTCLCLGGSGLAGGGRSNINLQAGLNLQYSAVTTTNQPASSDQPESQSVWRWLLTANCTSLHLTSYNPALRPNHSGTKPVGTDHFSTSTVSSLSLGSSCWLLFSLTNLTEREKERGFGLKLLKSRNRKSLFRVIFNEHSHVYSYTCYPTQF